VGAAAVSPAAADTVAGADAAMRIEGGTAGAEGVEAPR